MPAATRHDDILAILFEADIPFVLRRKDTGNGCYTLVGPAYIHGISVPHLIKCFYSDGMSESEDVFEQIRIY